MATDAGLVPDPESLVEAFHTEFDDLMTRTEYESFLIESGLEDEETMEADDEPTDEDEFEEEY